MSDGTSGSVVQIRVARRRRHASGGGVGGFPGGRVARENWFRPGRGWECPSARGVGAGRFPSSLCVHHWALALSSRRARRDWFCSPICGQDMDWRDWGWMLCRTLWQRQCQQVADRPPPPSSGCLTTMILMPPIPVPLTARPSRLAPSRWASSVSESLAQAWSPYFLSAVLKCCPCTRSHDQGSPLQGRRCVEG